jgi:hypothetical protein
MLRQRRTPVNHGADNCGRQNRLGSNASDRSTSCEAMKPERDQTAPSMKLHGQGLRSFQPSNAPREEA